MPKSSFEVELIIEEQARCAVSEAVASARIEGYVIDSESETLCMKLAEGSITQSEYIQRILELSKAILA